MSQFYLCEGGKDAECNDDDDIIASLDSIQLLTLVIMQLVAVCLQIMDSIYIYIYIYIWSVFPSGDCYCDAVLRCCMQLEIRVMSPIMLYFSFVYRYAWLMTWQSSASVYRYLSCVSIHNVLHSSLIHLRKEDAAARPGDSLPQ